MLGFMKTWTLLMLCACGGSVAPLPDREAPAPEPPPDAGSLPDQDAPVDAGHLPDANFMICPTQGAACVTNSPITLTCADWERFWDCVGGTWVKLYCRDYPGVSGQCTGDLGRPCGTDPVCP